MDFTLFKQTNRIANLVFTDEAIRLAEVKQGNPFQVVNLEEKLLPAGVISDGKIQDRETLEMILEEIIALWGLKKRKVRFVAPDMYIVIRKMLIPSDIAEDEVRNYLFLEIGNSIHLPFEDPLFDYLLLEEKEGKQEILLFASPEEVVLSYQEILEDVKLQPIAADISPLCLYRFYHGMQMTNGQNHEMILHFDKKLLTLTIFNHHRPIFLRPLSLQGENGVIVTEQEESVLFSLEDTFKEVEKVMNFYRYTLNKDEASVNKVFVIGDHPHLSEIFDHLNDRFDVRVESMPIIESYNKDDALLDPKFVVAIGLGLKEVI
ncbi:hypothetical protein Q73_10280 [Bacillus coahuilensis m2-6]|uniref:Pilus assembly protein PilM n=1 Tax=Bacillus coahuilensis p1.1.43 TaxID=1150625 RepID=A0A147K748_9BACI|nr:pilus assembly protein PilM [Bacillus coahuilensis]KUP05874.1 hypothetical protein Q75_10850 [Bacillus coahuilensis p1.1.43]KUP06970.1 hypothetical protein Q73_10280 [Bacillus coahuilensis m2-6]